MSLPELSVIIPTLNEAEALPLLLEDLACQKKVSLEVIVSDGGSADDTCRLAADCFARQRFTGELLSGPPGRGHQLNAGAQAARAQWLLFLHADSRLSGDHQLRDALDHIQGLCPSPGQSDLAGRFSLRFDIPSSEYSFGYYYYEAKAALGRPGCVHGDQGMLLSRDFFCELGSFREDLPVMEDTSLAEAVRSNGRWTLLPGEIHTSARRFQAEGMNARQTLNALMMNFLDIGWLEFFAKAPGIYRQQSRTGRLLLKPFLRLIVNLLREETAGRRLSLWMATGRYVRRQAWQIGWFLDCRKAFRRQLPPPVDASTWLRWFDRWFEPLTRHWPGDFITAVLVRAWFEYRLRCRS